MRYLLKTIVGAGLLLDAISFSSSAAVPPTVVTGTASLITKSAAALQGTVNPNGVTTQVGNASSSSSIYFQLGTTTNYGQILNPLTPVSGTVLTGNLPVDISTNIFTLTRGATYHYRLVATNLDGSTFGSDATFTTPSNAAPTPRETSVSVPTAAAVPFNFDLTDPDGDPVVVVSVGAPAHGTVTGGTQAGFQFNYTPNSSFTSEDEFTYRVSDDSGATAFGKIHMIRISKVQVGKYVTTVVPASGGSPVGVLGLDIASGGAFTGVLTYLGERRPFRGQMPANGSVAITIARASAPSLTVNLQISLHPRGVRLNGTVGTDVLVETTPYTYPDVAGETGSYTMVIPPADPSVPQGVGHMLGRVGVHGSVVFAGRTGDGTAFSFGTQLQRSGGAQFYVTAGSAPRDRLNGSIQFPGLGVSPVTGQLTWFKAPRVGGAYPSGFTTTGQVTGSRLVLSANPNILHYTTAAPALDVVFKDASGDTVLAGTLSGQNEQTFILTSSTIPASGAVVSLGVIRARGTFSGTYKIPGDNFVPHNFLGALLQGQNNGAGLTALAPKTGSVVITPK